MTDMSALRLCTCACDVLQVIEALGKEYGSLYTADNVCISGTHTHSTPAGFFQYVLFDITSIGAVNQTTQAYVQGMTSVILYTVALCTP